MRSGGEWPGGGTALLLALAVAAPHGQASGQIDPLRAPANDTVSVQEAGLRHLLETIDAHPLGELKTACLVIQDHDRWLRDGEVGRNQPELERFLRDELDLRTGPEVACVRGEGSERPGRLLRDSESGEAAAVLRISEPAFDSPTRATLSIGFHIGPLWGRGGQCELEKAEGQWSIKECKATWVS